jgi:phosphatidylserine/phosphatidylglycerophosphate/cardiolipin synthase-like enzyme
MNYELTASICIEGGLDHFLRTIEAFPSRYWQVIVCSPFIDESLRERIARFAMAARGVGCGVRVVTGLRQTKGEGRRFPGISLARPNLLSIPRLHAKVYLALGRDRRNSIAIVTSANLTEAGLKRNIELGLIFRGTSPEGARIVEEVRHFLESIARHKQGVINGKDSR